MKKSRILITCAKGVAPYLSEELLQLGFPVLDETAAGVETEGTLEDTYRLNLHLRTAHRVLLLIKEFAARDADDLYRVASEVPWRTTSTRTNISASLPVWTIRPYGTRVMQM